jgi:hypothetical protein
MGAEKEISDFLRTGGKNTRKPRSIFSKSRSEIRERPPDE